jgi:hypothetical protein
MCSAHGCGPDARRVAPFGNPRINACSPLPGAYRSKPRPSSPAGAKASIVCPYTLDRIRNLARPGRCCNFYPKLCCCQRTCPAPRKGARVQGPAARPQAIIFRSRARRTQMVGVPGIEPGTSSLSGTRSNQLSYTPKRLPIAGGTMVRRLSTTHHQPPTINHQPDTGGGNRDRTGDLMLAKHALYPLSYAPKTSRHRRRSQSADSLRRFRAGRDAMNPRWHGSMCGVPSRAAMPPARAGGLPPGSASRRPLLLRKEVIQPQVPLRLPCYDFIPITTHTLDAHAPRGFGRRLRVQTAFMM